MKYNIALISVFVACCIIFILDYYYDKKLTFIHKQIKQYRSKNLEVVLVFFFSFLVLYIFNNHKLISYINYSYQAAAFLTGHLDITNMPDYLESVMYNGHTYMHFAPGPAVLLLPFVWLFGLNFNVIVISLLLGAGNITLVYLILQRLNFNSTRTRLWITMLFGFGTIHFFLSVLGHSWFFGEICATFFILLAIYLIFSDNQKQFLLICFFAGFFFGYAVTCRMALLFSVFFFLLVIFKRKDRRISAMLFFLLGAAIPGGLYMLFNYLRYDTIIDLGYSLCFLKENPLYTGGPLQLRFVPYNLYSIFVMPPEFSDKFPFIIPSAAGTALTFTTPAFIYAFRAKGEKWLIAILAITIFLTAIPFLMNWGNGMSQFGMRYSMDFTPFLILLTAMGMRDMNSVKKLVILACIWVNAWGILFWNMVKN